MSAKIIFEVMKDRQWILAHHCLYWSGRSLRICSRDAQMARR